MIKYLPLVIIVFAFIACREKKTDAGITEVRKDSARFNDTFDTRDLMEETSIPAGTIIDTIVLKEKTTTLRMTIPRVLQHQYPVAAMVIDSLVKDTKVYFRELVAEDKNDTTGMFSTTDTWLNITSLYTSDKVVSISFTEGLSVMTSSYDFVTINYNPATGQRLAFSDFFKLDTPADTAFWLSVIFPPDRRKHVASFPAFLSEMTFAVDKENVYFFFARRHVLGIEGVIAVRRKFVTGKIREEYK